MMRLLVEDSLVLEEMDGLVAVSGGTAGEEYAAGEWRGSAVAPRGHQLYLLQVTQSLHVLVFTDHLRNQTSVSQQIYIDFYR